MIDDGEEPLDIALRGLRAVAAVAEALHFGRAANDLDVAQSAVSQQVRRLEGAVGADLLTRTSRSVTLTPAGRELLPVVRRMLAQLDGAATRARAIARGELGTLVLGAAAATRATLAPAVIAALAHALPNLRVDLRMVSTTEAAAGVIDGTLDAALVRDLEPTDGLRVEPVHREPVLVALGTSHRLASAADGPIALAQLADEPFVRWRRAGAPVFHDRLTAACRAAGFMPRVRYEVRGIEARLGLVAAGLGVALEPAAYATLHREGVVFRSLADESLVAITQLIVPATGGAPSLDALRAALRTLTARGASNAQSTRQPQRAREDSNL